MASAGISGAIAKRANETSKALGGKISYYWATLAVFAGWRTGEMRISVDDEIRGGKMIDALVANGRYLGGGMMMLPEAEPDDGLFDVLLLGDITKRDLLVTLPKSYRGKHLPHPRAEVLRGRVVSVDADEPLPIQLDGEQPGTTPARFEIVPKALRLRVPRSSWGEIYLAPTTTGLRRRFPGRGATRRCLRLLQRRDLLLELRDAGLELVDAAHLLAELVDPRAQVVECLHRLLPTRQVRKPLERVLADFCQGGTRSPCRGTRSASGPCRYSYHFRGHSTSAESVSPAAPSSFSTARVVERGRAAVDDRERARLERQSRDRPDLERRADDEDEPRPAHELGRPLHGARRQELAEERHAGLQDLAALEAQRRRVLLQLREDAVGVLRP